MYGWNAIIEPVARPFVAVRGEGRCHGDYPENLSENPSSMESDIGAGKELKGITGHYRVTKNDQL